MIIRILGEGQYQIADADLDGLQELDADLERAVEGDDEEQFRSALRGLLERVRTAGQPVPSDALDASDAILPGEDAHVDEVRALILDDGIIPG